MMYYHMDQTQLEKFTSRGQPDHLPLELTTNLDPDLREWLRKTYAPAFIARNISQLEKYKDRFQGNEMEKIWYWWAGTVRLFIYKHANVRLADRDFGNRETNASRTARNIHNSILFHQPMP